MDTDNYITQRNSIVKAYSHKLKIWEDDFVAGKFNLVSAGLHNYLPQIGYHEHEGIFKGILLHQRLSHLEQMHTEALKYVTCENMHDEIWDLLKKGGAILCTFHTGSYRIINQVLIKHKVPFTLVIAKSILDSQGDQFNRLHQRFSGDQDGGSFGIIDAESPSSGLQMLREIKRGRNLVLYIDGNTGAGSNDKEKNNLCDIKFLGQRIFARKGIAFLAHVLGAPILTVASYRKSIDDIRLRFLDPIYPEIDAERETFSQDTTQKIYDFAGEIITTYPEQWEGWMYLHKVAHIVNSADTFYKKMGETALNVQTILRLNLAEFGVLKLLDDFYLFRKSGYQSFHIDKDLYGFLYGSIAEPVMKREMDEATFSQLIENNVLVPA